MKITNKNFWTVFGSVVLFLILMTINFFVINRINNDAVRIFLLTLFSTIATVALVNVLWELIAKKNFADSLLEQVKISENIAKSGIDAVYMDFIDINWKTEFNNTTSFTAAFVYAYSWRSHNDAIIKKFASKNSRKKKMRIIVPDPEIYNVMSDLDRRFNFETGETKKRVEDCIDYYHKLGVDVYLFNGTLQAGYYLMDNVGIMSFFSHSKEKGAVPAIKAAQTGNMYQYIKNDLAAMLEQSDKIKSIVIKIVDGKRTVTIEREKDDK